MTRFSFHIRIFIVYIDACFFSAHALHIQCSITAFSVQFSHFQCGWGDCVSSEFMNHFGFSHHRKRTEEKYTFKLTFSWLHWHTIVRRGRPNVPSSYDFFFNNFIKNSRFLSCNYLLFLSKLPFQCIINQPFYVRMNSKWLNRSTFYRRFFSYMYEN